MCVYVEAGRGHEMCKHHRRGGGRSQSVVGGEGCPAGELFLSLSELLGC